MTKEIEKIAREFKSNMQDLVDKSDNLTGISVKVGNGEYIPIVTKSTEQMINIPTNLQISKVKYERKIGKVTIEYSILNDGKDDINVILKSNDEPLQEFIDRLNELSKFVETICQLPAGYCDQAEIRGVSFSHSNGVLGAVITALIPLDSANSPMVINTPHLPSEQYSETGESPVLSPKCVFVLKNLIVEAIRYIDGERVKEETNQTELELQ